ncbi:MAG: hypothetical protein JXR97_10990 [Planctomycetes bacterium]|nr:hypothetical protein [Planctomycetota bacterium]
MSDHSEIDSGNDYQDTYNSDEGLAVAEMEAPEAADGYDYDLEEILSPEFLETPEEAALELGSAEEYEYEEKEERSSFRSRRSKKDVSDLDPVVSARRIKKQRQAKLIIYGIVLLLVLAVVIVGSLRIPVFLHAGGYLDTPRIWPWTVILPQEEAPKETTVIKKFMLSNGKEITEDEFNAIYEPAQKTANRASSLFFDAEEKYKAATVNENLSGAERNSLVKEAVKLAQEAAELINDEFLENLRNYSGPRKINSLLKRAEEDQAEALLKAGTWKRQITIETEE